MPVIHARNATGLLGTKALILLNCPSVSQKFPDMKHLAFILESHLNL
jgi:hypothetical protein